MSTIDKQLWHTCKICQGKISDLAKKYGGDGVYYVEVFLSHLKIDHDNLLIEEYFSKYCDIETPKCPCGICNKNLHICLKGAHYFWSKYECGRTEGTMKWSEQAKITRKGSNNPMFGKKAWNDGLTKETSDILMNNSIKKTGTKATEEAKHHMSEAAKIRLVHGHTGHKHTPENKEKFRQNTLKMMKEGKFSQLKSKPHLIFEEILKDLNIEYEEEFNLDYWLFDFYLPKYKLYIEVDGDYFHSHPKRWPNGPVTKTQKINHARDLSKNKYCKQNNITLLRFWECDILKNKANVIETLLCIANELLELEKLEQLKLVILK